MLRLLNSDLPTVATPAQRSAPTFRLYRGDNSKALAPLFCFDRLANIDPPAFASVSTPLLYPDSSGYLFRLTLGFLWQELVRVSASSGAIGIVADGVDAHLNTAWGDVNNGAVNLYWAKSEAIVVEVIVAIAIPEPVNAQYTLSLQNYSGLSVTEVTASGLPFKLAANSLSPQPGEFVQSGNNLILYGSSVVRPTVAVNALVQGIVAFAPPSPIAVAMTFDLTAEELTYIDGADYLGSAYTPAQFPPQPQLFEFFWSAPLLTLFAPIATGQRLMRNAIEPSAQSFLGSTEYTSYP